MTYYYVNAIMLLRYKMLLCLSTFLLLHDNKQLIVRLVSKISPYSLVWYMATLLGHDKITRCSHKNTLIHLVMSAKGENWPFWSRLNHGLQRL